MLCHRQAHRESTRDSKVPFLILPFCASHQTSFYIYALYSRIGIKADSQSVTWHENYIVYPKQHKIRSEWHANISAFLYSFTIVKSSFRTVFKCSFLVSEIRLIFTYLPLKASLFICFHFLRKPWIKEIKAMKCKKWNHTEKIIQFAN